MIYESTRKMSVKEQEAYDLGYLNGKEAALRGPQPDPITGLPLCSKVELGKPTIIIHGREFPDAESLDWLADAVKEKLARQPDPITGLVPCGCGGKVDVAFYPGWHGVPDKYQVDCFYCHVGTRPCQTAKQAKAAWNTAMGWKGGAE